MFSLKINNDLIFLLLLLAHLKLEPSLDSRWHLESEVLPVHLGTTAAYTTQSSRLHTSWYPHPKSLEYSEVDSLYSRLHFFDTLRASRNSRLIACVADEEDKTQDDRHELTAEDMDLIEILWKQDIDLGISREAYDSRPCVETEKQKEAEIDKEKQDDLKLPREEPPTVPEFPAGLSYAIDSETGEYVYEEFPDLHEATCIDRFLKSDTNYPASNLIDESDTLLSEDSFLPLDSDFCNNLNDFSHILSPNRLSHLLNDDISADSDYLSQIENLGMAFENLDASNELDSKAGDATYSNMEECWPDATTMLPLLTFSNNHHQSSLAPLSPLSMNSFSTLSSSNNLPSPNRTSERFLGLLQNISMEVSTAEEEFQSANTPLSIGPSSIGCAVAESMATLTNSTDPLPDGSMINAAYSSDFPDLLYSNHTLAVPHNELLISDLLLEEDLQFVSVTSNADEEKQNEEHMDTSSDSVSFTSGQVLAVSDYESESRNFSDLTLQRVNCSNQQYYAMKSYCPDGSENGEKLSFSKKFEYSYTKPKIVLPGENNIMHHNHSYHLPFNGDEPSYKSVNSDKSKYLSEEDLCNKDEKRAKELKLPISISDIINLAIDEYNERLSKYELTDAQLTLIRDIRRRGKNKVAAQNCRKRKMDQISGLQHDLGYLQHEKMQLKSKQNHLLHEKHLYEEKYAQLYELVLQTSSSKPPNVPGSIPMLKQRPIIQAKCESFADSDCASSKETRLRKKYKK